MATTVCESCGETFRYKPQKGKNRRFCSSECRSVVHFLPTGNCKNCDKPFPQTRSHSASGRKQFCSRACRWNYERLQTPTAICEVCGNTFRRSASIFLHNAARFCSVACAESSGYKKGNGNHVPRTTTKCDTCGTEFEHRSTEPRVYCSTKCARNRLIIFDPQYRRIRNPKWIKLREKILDRDGHRCTQCGSTHGLSAHHLTPWRLTQDDSPENLTTLCRSCHLRADQALRTRQPLLR